MGRVTTRRGSSDAKPGRGVAVAPHVLVKNYEKYAGMYVATRSFKDKKVITAGKDMVAVHREAQKKGVEEPVVFYVPQKGMVYIY